MITVSETGRVELDRGTAFLDRESGKKYICIGNPATGCGACSLNCPDKNLPCGIWECSGIKRSDGLDVIFKEIR
jgi:coenzyme F420-reducing hydrogenase gamma subunit